MERIFVGILFTNAIMAFTLLIVCIQRRDRTDRGSRALQFFTCSSVIWSLGSGFLVMQTGDVGAHIARCVDLFGTVLYMNAIIMILNVISGIPEKLRLAFERFALLGFPLFFVSLFPGIFEFKRTDFGMSFSFANSVYGIVYTVFFVSSAGIMLSDIIRMLKSPKKSIVYFGKRFFAVWVLILCGSGLDMIFPMIGQNSVPGSSVVQFLGLIIVWYAMDLVNQSRVIVQNMSQKVYDSLSSPILMLDISGNIEVFNDAAKLFFDLEKRSEQTYLRVEHFLALEETEVDEYMNMSCFFDIPEDAEYADGGELLIFNAFCKSNNIYCNVRANRVRDRFNELIGYIAVVADLTEQLRAREKLEEARQEAVKANEAKSIFLANMSHEIRTPVNAIMGFSELALAENVSPLLHEYLTDINNASNVLLGSINDILNISKIESGKMDIVLEEYSLKNLLKNVCKIITVQASRKELSFAMNIKDNIPSILLGDDVRIQEILINLLNNAIKYTPNGDVSLSVSAKGDLTKGKDIELVLSVKDSGIGIKEDDLENLFKAYERVDIKKNHRTEGTGLGLPIVKGYVDLMGGTIDVKSEYGKGSEFIVTIKQKIMDDTPINPEDVMKSESEGKRFTGFRADGLKVLVVDDNKVNLKVISKTLEKYGISSDLATSGKEAITLCENTEYPIVFMDHMMPDMDGVETMDALKEAYPYYKNTATIVVLTANAIDGVKAELLDAGFDEYLSKPLNLTELEGVLQKHIPV